MQLQSRGRRGQPGKGENGQIVDNVGVDEAVRVFGQDTTGNGSDQHQVLDSTWSQATAIQDCQVKHFFSVRYLMQLSKVQGTWNMICPELTDWNLPAMLQCTVLKVMCQQQLPSIFRLSTVC